VLGFLGIGCLLGAFTFSCQAECRTNVSFVDAMQFGDGPLAQPSARFPYVAYSLSAKYGSFFQAEASDVQVDECASDAITKQVNGTHQSARGKASINASGGKPDFRLRAMSALGTKEASEINLLAGGYGKFRFRDVLTLKNAGTDPVNVAVTISMDGNVSRPLSAIPVPEQQGNALVRLLVEDLTFCQPGGRLISVSHNAQTQGPDYHATYVATVCPTAIVRVDLLVDLNATTPRFSQVGRERFLGGYTFADYTQCLNGNSVCFEDCENPDLDDCSGFSIRVKVVENAPGLRQSGGTKAAAAPVELVSAGGFDYAAPLPGYKPWLRVRQEPGAAVVEWPSGASDWKIASSTDLAAWQVITNAPGFNVEEMLYQLTWPATNRPQFFRLEKPL